MNSLLRKRKSNPELDNKEKWLTTLIWIDTL